MTAPTRACRHGARDDDDAARAPMAHVKPLRVLLADDYEANRMLQKAQLEELGYPTDAVANGEEVLRAMHARHYDVVLLDIGMPVMNGLETARRIRARKHETQPFLVAVTAGTVASDRALIRNAGFDVFIAKPAGMCDFATALEQAYAKKTGGERLFMPGSAANDDTVQLELGTLSARLGPAADALLRRVIPVYLRELPDRTAGLRAAFDRHDTAALAQFCHGLKGASRILGATELAAMCERSEQRAYEGTMPRPDELDELLDLAWRTGQELRRRLDALGA